MKKQTKIIRSTITMLIIFLIGYIWVPSAANAAVNTPAAPASIKAVSLSYNSITINWSSVTGASGYRVYRATSSTGTFTYLKTITTRSYKDTGLKTGSTYYYKVRAYKIVGSSKVYGKYSAVVHAKTVLPKPAYIKTAVTTYDSTTVSWSGVAGASGYRVYRALSKTESFTYLKSTTSLKYEDMSLDTGTTYYYKVRAYITVGDNKVFSDYTAIVNATCVLTKPTAFKVTSTSYDSVSLEWGVTQGASGYEIYTADVSEGPYTLLESPAETNYISTGLTAGKTYYYKLRAYRIVADNKVYGDYSPVVSANTPQIHATQVSLSESTVTLSLRKTKTLIATVTPDNAIDPSVTWSSSDESVAIVDSTGKVTPISEGTATITVTTNDNSLTSDCIVTVNKTKIKGIDVSKWQGTVDWALVKSNSVVFAMMRSSYGSSSVDPKFELNYAGAKENGIAVGVYHYSYATTVEKAITEVKFLINTLKGKQLEYPVCVDIEDTSLSKLDKKTVTDITLTYISYLEQAGYYPMVYSSKSWYTTKLDDSRLTDVDHWLAQWGTSYTYTGAVGIWQYSSTGKITGIATDVDLDYSFIDYEARIKYLKLNGFI